MFKKLTLFIVALPFVLHAQLGSPAAAPRIQESSRSWFFGYSANVPNEYIGVNMGNFGDGLLGYQFEAKTKTFQKAPQPITAVIPYTETGNKYENLVSVNAALNYGVTRGVILYLGAGLGSKDASAEIYFPSLGLKGWLANDTQYGLNMVGGVFLRLSPIYLQIGFDTYPAGLAVGLGLD